MILQIPSRILLHNVISDNNILYSSWKFKSTFYDILNVKKDSNTKEIRDAYIKLSKLYHPDNSNGSHKKFLKINEAYNTLSKFDLRRNYDYQLANPHPQGIKMKYNAYYNNDFDWSEYNNSIFRTKYKYKSSEQQNGYYGVKGIKKQTNFVIALICLFISIVGLSIQVILVKNSHTLRRDKMQSESLENEILLQHIRETSNLNGRELQIELLRQKFEQMKQEKVKNTMKTDE
ncbi:hypothetical protein WA026_015627 [Henosepilachna vigintioctopunctata]|uniref:J domain-containing protein n=1 Tax=Henosepilachna vigintioctopunctata TaxID=420089 RepID=A0AAW1VHD7_9CUCU